MPIEDVLKDGVVLCELINKIKPGLINKINTSGGEFKMMENINKYELPPLYIKLLIKKNQKFLFQRN